MDEKKLSTNLKRLRKAHGFTQDYVAVAIGVVRQTYSHYETGKRVPPPETLLRLSGLYDVSIDALLQSAANNDSEAGYDAPAKGNSAVHLEQMLDYLDQPSVSDRFKYLDVHEKELMFYFHKLTPDDREEIVDIMKLKVHRKQKHSVQCNKDARNP